MEQLREHRDKATFTVNGSFSISSSGSKGFNRKTIICIRSSYRAQSELVFYYVFFSYIQIIICNVDKETETETSAEKCVQT